MDAFIVGMEDFLGSTNHWQEINEIIPCLNVCISVFDKDELWIVFLWRDWIQFIVIRGLFVTFVKRWNSFIVRINDFWFKKELTILSNVCVLGPMKIRGGLWFYRDTGCFYYRGNEREERNLYKGRKTFCKHEKP